MTTETEPMVRIVSIICECCGREITPENCPTWAWEPMTPTEVRRDFELPFWCPKDIGGCGAFSAKMRVATEPVR